MADTGDRRLKLLFIDPASFMALFKEGLKVREGYKLIGGLPGDARMVGVSYDVRTGGVIFIVASEEFEHVPEGRQLPVVPVAIRTGKAS